MRILLDTHALVWWIRDVPLLGQKARAIIADNDNIVSFSIVSCWEAAVKHRIGKMDITGTQLWREGSDAGFTPIGLEPRHISELERLPQVEKHRDPFDHLLLVQAILDADALMTHDRALPRYGVRCIGVG